MPIGNVVAMFAEPMVKYMVELTGITEGLIPETMMEPSEIVMPLVPEAMGVTLEKSGLVDTSSLISLMSNGPVLSHFISIE